MRALPVEADPPDHAKYRGVLIPWLAARKVNTYEAAIRSVVTELINAFIEQGTCDLIPALATPLPALVSPIFMGIAPKDQPLFLRYIKQIIEATEMQDKEKDIKIRQSFMHYLLKEIEKRKRKPRSDFFSSLIEAKFNDRLLTEEEIISLMLTILTAGLETSKNALSSLLLALCEHDGIRQRLMHEPALIPSFVEESLRYNAPLQYVGRTVNTPVSMYKCTMVKDEKVLLLLGSANHDEKKFAQPEQFIVDRAPNRHLTFGLGAHFCVGAPFARLELRIVAEEILHRLPDYRLAKEVKRAFSVDRVYGVETLPIVFSPGTIEPSTVLTQEQ